MRTQIPKFRLPETVLDEEVNYILDLQPELRLGQKINSLKNMLAKDYDAIFVGCGAPRGRALELPGGAEAKANIHIGIDWLSSVSFGHTTKIGKRVIVLGGGNTAMDCCRTSRRLGGEQVNVVVRSGFDEMKASPWEKEDAMHEGIPIHNYLGAKGIYARRTANLPGSCFSKRLKPQKDAKGQPPVYCPPVSRTWCISSADDVLVAVGQENSFPMDRAQSRSLISTSGACRKSLRQNHAVHQSTLPKVFFGGDAAFGPKNIIWAVAHGHEAAISIDKFCAKVKTMSDQRPPPMVTLMQSENGHSRVELRQRCLCNDYALQGTAERNDRDRP